MQNLPSFPEHPVHVRAEGGVGTPVARTGRSAATHIQRVGHQHGMRMIVDLLESRDDDRHLLHFWSPPKAVSAPSPGRYMPRQRPPVTFRMAPLIQFPDGLSKYLTASATGWGPPKPSG